MSPGGEVRRENFPKIGENARAANLSVPVVRRSEVGEDV